MPIDGTYGRLSAHNRRMNDFKHKKKERKNNINSAIKCASSPKKKFPEFNSETIETVKAQIRLKAQIRKRKEKNIWIGLSILGVILTIYMIYFLLNL